MLTSTLGSELDYYGKDSGRTGFGLVRVPANTLGASPCVPICRGAYDRRHVVKQRPAPKPMLNMSIAYGPLPGREPKAAYWYSLL